MSIKSDKWIKRHCESNDSPMITPFNASSVKHTHADGKSLAIISKGLSSYGYDVTLDRDIRIFTNINSSIIDPRKMDEDCFVTANVLTGDDGAEYVLLPPNSYLLGHTEEYFNIPRNVLVICLGKSTYARAGIAVNCTPIEPEFTGNVVIEAANQTTLPAKIYVGQGIAQFLFFESDEDCEVSYADRGGKYNGQRGLVHAKV